MEFFEGLRLVFGREVVCDGDKVYNFAVGLEVVLFVVFGWVVVFVADVEYTLGVSYVDLVYRGNFFVDFEEVFFRDDFYRLDYYKESLVVFSILYVVRDVYFEVFV